MFKMFRDYLKIRRYCKAMDVLNDLCDAQGSCENCKAYLGYDGTDKEHRCAQCYILDQFVGELERLRREKNEKNH